MGEEESWEEVTSGGGAERETPCTRKGNGRAVGWNGGMYMYCTLCNYMYWWLCGHTTIKSIADFEPLLFFDPWSKRDKSLHNEYS